jgi:hypothetical protein
MEKRSLREVISETRIQFKMMSADTNVNISDRYIGSLLQSVALNFIKQATDKRKLWNSPNLFRPLACLKLKQVPLSDCCDYVNPCVITRTVKRLPKIAEGTHFGMLIQGVYSVDYPNPNNKARRFIESTPDRYANTLGMKLKHQQIHFWLQDKYLYTSSPELQTIKILAYFEEDIPEDLLYCSGDKKPCCPINPYDEEFQCPGYMYNDVIKETANILSSTYGRSTGQKTDDKIDETSMAPQRQSRQRSR